MQEVPAEGAPPARQTAGVGSRTLRNTVLILAARVVSRTLALGSVLVLIRHLQPVGLGQFQDVVNLAALATVFLDAGFNTLFQREAARRPAMLSDYLSGLATGRLGFAVLALAVFAGFLAATGRLQYLLPAFAMMVLASYSNLLRGALYAVPPSGVETTLTAWGFMAGRAPPGTTSLAIAASGAKFDSAVEPEIIASPVTIRYATAATMRRSAGIMATEF